jgi:hypothetical protein
MAEKTMRSIREAIARLPRIDDDHIAAGARQICRCGKAGKAAAHDDGISRHVLSPA